MSGVPVDRIMRRAGHDSVQTTLGYVKQAEDLGGELGEPFAALPDELVREDELSKQLSKSKAVTTTTTVFQA